MAQQTLSLATLGTLDGGAAEAIINQALREVGADLADRGEDLKPRKVEVNILFKPRKDGGTEIEVSAIAKVPKRHTASTSAVLRGSSQTGVTIKFNDMARREPNQRTIDEVENE